MNTPTFESYTYSIAQHWVNPLVYGDYTYLEDDEVAQVNAFVASLPDGMGHWANWSASPSFARDDVGGLMADCYEATYLVREAA